MIIHSKSIISGIVWLWWLVGSCPLAAQPASALEKDGPFPIVTYIAGKTGENLTEIRIYQQIVKLYDDNKEVIGTIGYHLSRGELFLYLVADKDNSKVIARSRNRLLYDAAGVWRGSYGGKAAFMYAFDNQLNRLGQTKCLFRQELCGAVAAAYLLGLWP